MFLAPFKSALSSKPQVYRNYIRPREAPGGKTPAETCGNNSSSTTDGLSYTTRESKKTT